MEWLSRFFGSGKDLKGFQGLPRELVLTIENTHVFFRSSQSEEGEAYVVVSVAYLGKWRFDGIQDAADRIAKVYPDLSRQACVRAGKLIAVMVGRANRAAGNNRRPKPRDPIERIIGLDDFWR